MIRGILFDIDGVLVDSVRANAQMYRDLLGHFGVPGPTDEEQAASNHRTFIDNIRHYARGASDELIQQIFDYGVSQPRSHDMLVLMDGVKETLQDLHKRYLLGVVSSRLHMGIGSLLDHFGLGALFPVRVGFEDTTKHKPHPGPLLFGAQKLGVKPYEVSYIGDSVTDVEAARAAGMKMVHYATASIPGDHATVSRFRDLVAAIERL